MFAIFSQFFRNWKCSHLYWKNFGLTRKNFKSASCKLDNYLIYHTQVCFQIVHFLPDKPLILNFDSWLITSRREVSDKLSTIVSSTLIIKFLLIFSLCTYFVFFCRINDGHSRMWKFKTFAKNACIILYSFRFPSKIHICSNTNFLEWSLDCFFCYFVSRQFIFSVFVL